MESAAKTAVTATKSHVATSPEAMDVAVVSKKFTPVPEGVVPLVNLPFEA